MDENRQLKSIKFFEDVLDGSSISASPRRRAWLADDARSWVLGLCPMMMVWATIGRLSRRHRIAPPEWAHAKLYFEHQCVKVNSVTVIPHSFNKNM
jgi:hypothetical protein